MKPKHYLDLCTDHITQDAMEQLQQLACQGRTRAGWPAMTVANYEYGVFVTVPGELTEAHAAALPPSLATVLALAQQLGAELVRFDRDAEAWPDLLEYDW